MTGIYLSGALLFAVVIAFLLIAIRSQLSARFARPPHLHQQGETDNPMQSGASGLAAAAPPSSGYSSGRKTAARRGTGGGLQIWDAIWLSGGAIFIALFIAFAWVTK